MIYINGILAKEEDLNRLDYDILVNRIWFTVYKNKQGVQFIWTE